MDVCELCAHFLSLYFFRWQELYNNHYLPFCARFKDENIEGLPMTSSSFLAARKEHRPYYKKHRKVYSAIFILFIINLMSLEYIGKKHEMETY
jgi:quinol-cytochrome oxidoreductase complex cytochrome b subunit